MLKDLIIHKGYVLNKQPIGWDFTGTQEAVCKVDGHEGQGVDYLCGCV